MLDKPNYHEQGSKKKTCPSKAQLTGHKHPDFDGRLLAYVTNNADVTVSAVDVLRSKKIKDITVGKYPLGIDISPDKKYLYVSNSDDATLSVIRTFDNQVVDTINLTTGAFEGNGPSGVKVSKDGRFIYVANYLSRNMSVVDALERRVITTIPLPFSANLLDITKDGLFAYVTLNSGIPAPAVDQVAVVDLNSNLLMKTIPVGTNPQDIAISPVRPLAYVANSDSQNVTIINTELAQSSPNNIPVGRDPFGVAFNPTGKKAFVTNYSQDNITVIDVFTHTPLLNIPLNQNDGPTGIRVTPNGKFILVANFVSNTMAIIDARTYQVLSRVQAGNGPLLIAILDTCRE